MDMQEQVEQAGQTGSRWRRQLLVLWGFVATNTMVLFLFKAFFMILGTDMALDRATREIFAWYPWLIAGFTACSIIQIIFTLSVFKIKEVPTSARLATAAVFIMVLVYFDYWAFDWIRSINLMLEYQLFN